MVLSFSYFYIFIHFAHFVPPRDYRETLRLATYYRGRVPVENPGEVIGEGTAQFQERLRHFGDASTRDDFSGQQQRWRRAVK